MPAETPAEAVAATTAPEAVPAATGEKTTVSYWYDPPEEGAQANCFVEQVINKFNQNSTSVTVDAIQQPNSWDATRTALAGGAGPDIVVTPGPSFAFELVQAGQLLPLDEYVQQLSWSKRFVPWALNLGKVDGKLYSIPNELETLVLYYNKTLFEQKGWQPPKTMDELAGLAAKVKEAGIIPFAHANAEWRPTNEWFVGEWMNHVAGPQKVYEALTGKAKWTDPEFARAMTMLNDFQQQGYFMGGLDRYYTATGNERSAAFGAGEAAMNIEGTWFLASAATYFGEQAGNQNDWDWVPVPSVTGEAIFDLGIGSTYSINKATKNSQAAVEFLDFLFSSETQSLIVSACGNAPAPVRLTAEALTSIDPRNARVFEELSAASDANNYGYTTWTFWPPKSDLYIYEEIEKVWAKEQTVEDYLAGLQKIFDEEVKAGDIPPIPVR
jgi:raffinose/stachyose/melibiose transport system substrate-binding protein